jgi:hypothetical protein
MPCTAHTSRTVISPRAAWAKMSTICASVNLDFFNSIGLLRFLEETLTFQAVLIPEAEPRQRSAALRQFGQHVDAALRVHVHTKDRLARVVP